MMVSSRVIVVIDIAGEPRWDQRPRRSRNAPPDPKRRAKVKAARKAARKNRKRKQRIA